MKADFERIRKLLRGYKTPEIASQCTALQQHWFSAN
jgi:hypothetical protein